MGALPKTREEKAAADSCLRDPFWAQLGPGLAPPKRSLQPGWTARLSGPPPFLPGPQDTGARVRRACAGGRGSPWIGPRQESSRAA